MSQSETPGLSSGHQRGFFGTLGSYPSTFWVANVMEVFERMAWYGFYAVSTLYITGSRETGALGFTSEQRGQIQAIVPFILYLMPLVTGALADRYGYKKMFVIAYLVMIASYYALGQFTGLWTFMLAFFFVAVGAAIFKPVIVGTIARVTDESNSSMGFGIFYMIVNIGGFVGPLVAGVLRGLSWDWVFIMSSVWAAVNLMIVILLYREPTSESGSRAPRTLQKVLDDMVEVLGNLRFFVTVFVVLIALMVANQEFAWFTWTRCLIFVPVWLVLNFLWDVLLDPESGRPVSKGGVARPFFMKRMHCSNWRFALFLLIMSGFWTSFNQIFITMPEYIRDYTDTRPMVHLTRSAVGAIGKPQWIDGFANVEADELYTHFDGMNRQLHGRDPLVEEEESEEAATTQEADAAATQKAEAEAKPLDLAKVPGLTAEDIATLEALAAALNARGATDPLEAADFVEAAKAWLGYKVRITPVRFAEFLEKAPGGPVVPTSDALDVAIESVNRRLVATRKAPFDESGATTLKASLMTLLGAEGALVAAESLATAAKALSTDARQIEPKVLALGLRRAAYHDHLWDYLDDNRQFNPEHIVNIDALSIVFLQVLISFMMARFHRFTTMIVGMIIAAVGIGLPAFCGGTMIGPVGGMVILVIVGIVVFAIGEMMASPTSQEYVGRIAPKDKAALYMGYYFVAVALGNLFGGILSGQLSGKLARDMQRPDLMWLAFGGLMLLTAIVFMLYNKFALPRSAAHTLTANE